MAIPGDRSGRPHICHLTVLNPARHSRIFFKEARSQVKAGFRVSIIGQDAAAVPYFLDGVQIIPCGIFSRLSRERFRARKRVIALALEQHADLYQIHTPELLGPARSLPGAVPGCRLVYDMHEDYALNIRTAGYYPRIIRSRLARLVRRRERAFCGYGHGLILAEDCFQGILDFPAERQAVVRNKFLPPDQVAPAPGFGDPGLPLLVHTGTIAENWGAMRALELWQAMQEVQPLRLAVVGHTHDTALLERMAEFVRGSGLDDRFLLVGGADYVPYEAMVGWIRAANAGLALYQLRPNIRERIPTKFYEFMAAGKPVVHTANPAWEATFGDSGLSFPLEFPLERGTLLRLGERLRKQSASPAAEPALWSWESEAGKLEGLLSTILERPS